MLLRIQRCASTLAAEDHTRPPRCGGGTHPACTPMHIERLGLAGNTPARVAPRAVAHVARALHLRSQQPRGGRACCGSVRVALSRRSTEPNITICASRRRSAMHVSQGGGSCSAARARAALGLAAPRSADAGWLSGACNQHDKVKRSEKQSRPRLSMCMLQKAMLIWHSAGTAPTAQLGVPATLPSPTSVVLAGCPAPSAMGLALPCSGKVFLAFPGAHAVPGRTHRPACTSAGPRPS